MCPILCRAKRFLFKGPKIISKGIIILFFVCHKILNHSLLLFYDLILFTYQIL